MRARDNRMPFAELAVDYGGFGGPRFDGKGFGILGKHLHTAGVGRELVSIHKDPAAVVVAPELLRERRGVGKRIPLHSNPGRPRTALALVGEPPEGAAAACPREEAQFPAADDLEAGVPHLELAAAASIVAARAKPQIGTPAEDEVGDGTVAFAVERTAVAEICAAGEDEQGAGGSPRLFQKRRLGDGDHGIVGTQQSAQGVDAVPDRLER